MSESDERQSDLAVMDANEYKNKRRLKRILDMQEAVEDAASDAYQLKVDGRFTDDAQNIVVLRKVKSLLREVYTLFNISEEDEHSKYWEQANIGTLTLPNSGEELSFTGLKSILYADEYYQESWIEEHPSRHGPNSQEIQSAEHTLPEWISWRAYLICRQFLSDELDLDLQFEDMDDSLQVWGYEELPDVKGTEDLIDEDEDGGEAVEADD